MTDKLYADALFTAYDELTKLAEQERTIAVRKAQLKLTVDALYPLVFENSVDINSLSLPDAMRLVFRSVGRPLNAHDFKTKLDDMGFDLSQYSDPKANILTAMNRMVDSGEFTFVEGTAKKTVIGTPELKPVPQAPAALPSGLDALLPFSNLSGLAGLYAPAAKSAMEILAPSNDDKTDK